MELQLSYDPQIRHRTNAAFLRGNSPEQWFREMSDWQISLKGLTCFLLPEHKSSITPGGLLVIFHDQLPANGKINHPYTAINGNLYIPVNATLTSELSVAEMKELLIWDLQVFHPAIGFVGFNEDDKLQLSRFLSAGQAIKKNWDHAHPGMPPLALLQSISVDMPPGTDLAGLLNNGETIRPLSELPGKKPRTSMLFRMLDLFVKLLLLVILGFVSILSLIWPHRFVKTISAEDTGFGASTANGKPVAIGKEGFITRLRKWLERKIKDLDERRQSELDRLLKMFDKDGDEALKYAIPIGGSATPGRGAAPQSDSLRRQDTDFNLRKLYSNGPVSTWVASDDFSMQLVQKYELMAQKALDQGDYRKTAYIYAHLLGNLHKAATVLEEGQFYHEAAALYRNNLNLPIRAAECFEKAGLLLDAISIYKELDRFEKTGDLYRQLSQDTAAEQYFRLAVHEAGLQNNHLEAARILQYKCGRTEEAVDVLLKGWHHDNKAVTCLTQYFQLSRVLDENSIPDKIRRIYEQETPENKKDGLIEVLFNVRSLMPPAAQHTITDVVYEIISPQIAAGNEQKMAILKKLIPDDKELPADIYRYSARQNQEESGPVSDIKISFQLEQHIQWLAATVIKKQLLFAGTYGNTLYVLRMTPQGAQKYYSWQLPHMSVKDINAEHLTAWFSENDASRSGTKLLRLISDSRRIDLGKLTIRSEKPFGGKVILDTTDYPAGYMAAMLGMTLDDQANPVMVYVDRETSAVLISNSFEGSLHYCIDDTRVHMQVPGSPVPLLGSGGYYFSRAGKIYIVGRKGTGLSIELGEEIRYLTGIQGNNGQTMMAAITKGCLMVVNYRDDIYTQKFADDIIVRSGQFVSGKYLVIAPLSHSTAIVYDVTKPLEPVLKTHIRTAAPVLYILPTGEPGEVVLVDEKGRISVHQLDEKEQPADLGNS
ncbi:hypothetical protein [Chitinophaga sp. S165]|uniref:hypothetical protein n=1 Tax=Chitinophaga sp. S165 TaxID=2135462 RepID=UPI000D70B68A|nr:hypothetical protein [Chitinophaga sp. S165]PWV51443.1 hypothetical protein C7475_10352 [Chitinophaga sp. S165]